VWGGGGGGGGAGVSGEIIKGFVVLFYLFCTGKLDVVRRVMCNVFLM
jgi:hypothetical protein